MKKVQKLMTILLSFMVVLGLIAPNLVKAQGGQTDVVIHKIKLTDLTGWPKQANPDGTYPGVSKDKKYDGSKLTVADYFGEGAEELPGVKFIYWEVEKQKYETMMADPSRYETKDQVKALLNNDGTTTQATTANGVKVTLNNDKYYWFIEDFGSNIGNGNTLSGAKAVPFGLALPIYKPDGTEFSTGEGNELHIYPKNTISKPKIDKNFKETGADYNNYSSEKAEVSKTIGSKVPYQVKTDLPKDARYKTLRWEDVMDKGLTYNKDLTVKITKKLTSGDEDKTAEFITSSDYTIAHDQSGFVLQFTNDGLNKLEEKLKETNYEIEFSYSATLNADAVIDNPEENRIKFDYSNNPKTFNDPKNTTTQPNNKEITVNKNWDEDPAPQGVEVTYFLYEKDTAEQNNDKVVAIHKVENNNYNHTFTNLDNAKTYYVKEIVKGYNEVYSTTNNGTINVTNKKDNDNPESLIPTKPKVITHGKKFVKTDNESAGTAKTLVGAEFVVKSKNGATENKYLKLKDQTTLQTEKQAYTDAETAYKEEIKKYNELSKEAQEGEEGTQAKQTIKEKQAVRDEAFKKIRIDYEWTDQKDQALKLTSNTDGQFEVTGLEAGNYALEETKAPVGFALRTEEIAFEVAKNSYTENGNIAYTSANGTSAVGTDALQIKNKKVTIPQTGGIGTIIFTIVGLSIMGAALLAMKRRKEEQEA